MQIPCEPNQFGSLGSTSVTIVLPWILSLRLGHEPAPGVGTGTLSWCPLIVSMSRFPPAPDLSPRCPHSQAVKPSPKKLRDHSGAVPGQLLGQAGEHRHEEGNRGSGAAGGSWEMLKREGGREGGVLSSLRDANYPTLLLILQLSL